MNPADPPRRAFLASAFGAPALAAFDADALAQDAGSPTAAESDSLLTPGVAYLNTGSLGPCSRAVLNRTIEEWTAVETNPVAMVYGDGEAHKRTDRVRERAALFLGCEADRLMITRSTTEAMNTVAQGMLLERGDRVLTTDQEHHGGSVCWTYLGRRRGIEIDVVKIAPLDVDAKGIVDRFAAAIRPTTRVISVSHVITTTGLRMPIAELSALARSRGILCVVDGAQAIGNIAIDIKGLGCHAYAASGHKWLRGTKGTGFLFVSPDAGARIEPIQCEAGRRFVTNSIGVGSVPLVAGLGAAIDAMTAMGMAEVERHNLALRTRAWEGLQRMKRVKLASPPPGPHATAMVAFEIPAELDSVAVRLAISQKHGVVLKTVEKHWFNGLRISTHVFNTESDVDRALAAIAAEVG